MLISTGTIATTASVKRLTTSNVLGVVAACLALDGCAFFQASKNSAIDYRQVSVRDPTILTLTPERRTVLVVPSAYNGANTGLRTCPEPPPDVAEALTSAAMAGLNAANGKDMNAALQISQSFNTAVSQLFYRTQGAELFRDGNLALCLAWLNDIYKTTDLQAWRTDFKYLLDISSNLITAEVIARGGAKGTPSATATTGVAPNLPPDAPPSKPDVDPGRPTQP